MKKVIVKKAEKANEVKTVNQIENAANNEKKELTEREKLQARIAELDRIEKAENEVLQTVKNEDLMKELKSLTSEVVKAVLRIEAIENELTLKTVIKTIEDNEETSKIKQSDFINSLLKTGMTRSQLADEVFMKCNPKNQSRSSMYARVGSHLNSVNDKIDQKLKETGVYKFAVNQ